MGKLKNEKVSGKDEATGDSKGWRLTMAFESGVLPEDWRSAVIVTLYKEKEDNIKIIGINLLSVVGKIYAGILVDIVRSD